MTMSSSSSPQEETTAPTRVDWSDDDDFFGEDDDNDDDNDDDEKIESFDGEWDESFGVDDDLNSSARQVEQDETSNDDYDDDELVEPGIAENETDSDNDDDVDDDDDSEQSEVSDGIAEETPEKTTATVATDDEHEQEEEKEHEHEIIGEAVASDGGDGASPTDADNTALNPAPILKLAQRTSSPNRVSSGGKPPLATDNGIFERVPRSPNIMSSIFGDGAGIVGASSVGLGSPFSLNETPGTPLPFVELDGEDEKFEEIVRKRNRVSCSVVMFITVVSSHNTKYSGPLVCLPCLYWQHSCMVSNLKITRQKDRAVDSRTIRSGVALVRFTCDLSVIRV